MCEREGGEGGREGLKQAQLLKKQNYSLLCGKIVLNACISPGQFVITKLACTSVL